MAVAALFDIHANLPALDAVLDEVRDAHVDRIVVGGDVLPGPMPRETLARLLALEQPVEFIFGNGEVAVLESMAGREPTAVPASYRPAIQWTARQALEYQGVLGEWPRTVRLDIPGLGGVLFCHATPRDENQIFTRRTAEQRLLPIFDGLGVSAVVCGHTHMTFDRMVGATRVVNAGSVGMPFGDPGADWLLLGPDVRFRHTPYDLPAAAARIRAAGYPFPGDFAQRYILQPPSAAEMLDVFSRASL
jgi:predicted phosphodiesterase